MMKGAPDAQTVVHELQRILDSHAFANAPRCRELLSFVTTESLAGRGHLLNERVVARSALGRPPTMDTRTDAGARVQARRTRELLDRYYADEGCDAPVRISIPTGQYATTFHRVEARAGTERVEASEPVPSITTGPVLAVLQFRHRAGGVDRRVALGLSESLVHTLSAFPGLRVVGPLVGDGGQDDGADALRAAGRASANVVLHGAVWASDETVRVSVHLTDAIGRRVRWSDTFEHPLADFTGFGAEDEILRQVVATVGDFGGVVLRERFDPAPGDGDPQVAEALWRYYSFMDQLDPNEAFDVVDRLQRAIDREPENAHLLASLGFTFTVDVLMRGAVAIESIALAEEHGRRALLADPTNAVAQNVLAVVELAKGHESSAARHAEEVLRLARHHPGNAYVAGMVLGASGQWDRGIGIIRDTVRLNPYGPNHRHTLLSIDALRRDDVADALAEASFLDFPAYLYGPLLRGLCLHALGFEDQAQHEIDAALAVEPALLDRPVDVLSAAPTIPTDAAEHLAARLAAARPTARR
jgi:TolB-like protein